ncbi:rhamnulokinase family protein [Salinicoccus roseus]|uniref:rhamnulokinase n=1 Tax=Salinicoccus roseus TaxID=45670 RepID=UPI0035235BF4
MKNYVAVDIGASSGRVVLSHIEEEKIVTDEVHRFANGFIYKGGFHVWDVEYLFEEIMKALSYVKSRGVSECYLSIDTWGVDYVLLDSDEKRLREVVSYRDERTEGMMEKFFSSVSKKRIFELTGIQFLKFNTLYQLNTEEEDTKQSVSSILLIPDYLNFLLTGKMTNEITNLSTTQLMDVEGRRLNDFLLKKIDLTPELFKEPIEPGTYIGKMNEKLQEKYDTPKTHVYSTCSHDTASAVLGAVGKPNANWAFLSSGTWSLIGIEMERPIVNEKALSLGYSNERGINNTYRFLKNIIGMWAVQRIRKDWPVNYTFPEMVEQAKRNEHFKAFVDLNDKRFLNPVNMVEEIQVYCMETDQDCPKTLGEIVRTIYLSLAILYALSLEELEKITEEEIEAINIVGGGANNDYLNELTSYYSGCEVIVGPTEATIYGNLSAVMIGNGEFETVRDAREVIRKSNDIKTIKLYKDKTAQEDIEIFKEVTKYEQ